MLGWAVVFGFADRLSMAQMAPAPPPLPSAAAPGSPELLSAAQLDQLTAPIALYPDPLLAEILTAATYPLEIVEAARWLNDPANASLQGNDLVEALQSLPWDPSVKALVAVPQVLRQLDANLEWTEQIGDAFLAQQSDVMDSVQRLRSRAALAGALPSTAQETVGNDNGDVTIEPTASDVIYVPYYVPSVVFAPWPWPDDAPYYFEPPPDVVYGAALIGFGAAIPIVGPLWGGYRWNWPHHGLTVSPRLPPAGHPWSTTGGAGGGAVSSAPHPWVHDPAHRAGVPYRTEATAARFSAPQGPALRAYRGFQTEAQAPLREPERTASGVPPSAPPAPAFESFGRGSEVREDSARGVSSRAPPPPAPAAAPREPAGGGRGRH